MVSPAPPALANVSGAEVYSAEAAATYGPLFFQGEYFWYNVDRNFRPGLTDVKFEGGYARRIDRRDPHLQSRERCLQWGRPVQSVPADRRGLGRLGDCRPRLDDQSERSTCQRERRRRRTTTIYTAALKWYVNRNVRFMLDYLHGNITK
jgi:phosphate-selective porin OprO/OprP